MSALYFYFYILYKDLSDYRKAGRQAGKDHIFTKVKERDQQDEIDAWLLAAATTTT